MMVLQVFSYIPLKKRCQFRGEHIFKMISNASASLNIAAKLVSEGHCTLSLHVMYPVFLFSFLDTFASSTVRLSNGF